MPKIYTKQCRVPYVYIFTESLGFLICVDSHLEASRPSSLTSFSSLSLVYVLCVLSISERLNSLKLWLSELCLILSTIRPIRSLLGLFLEISQWWKPKALASSKCGGLKLVVTNWLMLIPWRLEALVLRRICERNEVNCKSYFFFYFKFIHYIVIYSRFN